MNVHVLFRMNFQILTGGILVRELGSPRTVVLIYPLLPYLSPVLLSSILIRSSLPRLSNGELQ
jgi:hypothetical protein